MSAFDTMFRAREFRKENAEPCEECGGRGVIAVKLWPGGIEVDGERYCECPAGEQARRERK